MDGKDKVICAVSYLAWIGWVIAFLLKKQDRMVLQHINQAFILNAVATLSGVVRRIWFFGDTLCSMVNVAVLVLIIIGIYYVIRGKDEPLPLIGTFASPDNSFFRSFTGKY